MRKSAATTISRTGLLEPLRDQLALGVALVGITGDCPPGRYIRTAVSLNVLRESALAFSSLQQEPTSTATLNALRKIAPLADPGLATDSGAGATTLPGPVSEAVIIIERLLGDWESPSLVFDMGDHTVREGEHLTRIAEEYGFRDFHSIWDDGANSKLKEKRESPNVLNPGDILKIPEKSPLTEGRPTTKIHIWQVPSNTLNLEIILKDENDEPRQNTPCSLTIEGHKQDLTTDPKGKIRKEDLPFKSEIGNLVVDNFQIPLRIGHMDPVDEVRGKVARLNNLGYDAGNIDEGETDETSERFRSAVEEFQCDTKLHVDGKCGAATQAKLKEVHGC
jgi:hypothetical protein